jgi:type IV pilus assembly protein PilM
MLSFVQSWFSQSANPIGIDFGSDALRMAQVENVGGECKLVAAARADVPTHLRNDPAGRLAFFTESVRELWSQGNFRGRRAILSLPASVMTIQHLRLPKMDEEALKKSLAWECRGKLPYDPTHALLRHLIAGDVFADGEQKHEVIVMAAQREWVNQFLAAAAKARLDVVAMNVEAKAMIDCFARVYRRKSDHEAVNLYVDIGSSATRAMVAQDQQILFARSIPVGGEHFTRAVAKQLEMSVEDARILRSKICHAQALAEMNRISASQPPAEAGANADEQTDVEAVDAAQVQRVEAAYEEPLQTLVHELSLCRRYHESTFTKQPVTRLIFVGGEARHRGLCQRIAQSLDLAAQIGDPMARMARTTEVGPESGIDRRLPQPDWSVALGLTMGPQNVPAAATAASK